MMAQCSSRGGDVGEIKKIRIPVKRVAEKPSVCVRERAGPGGCSVFLFN